VPIKTVCANCIHGKEMRRGRRYPITKRRDKRDPGRNFFSEAVAQDRRIQRDGAGEFPRDRELLKRVQKFQPK
jgi:hypothetical protein